MHPGRPRPVDREHQNPDMSRLTVGAEAQKSPSELVPVQKIRLFPAETLLVLLVRSQFLPHSLALLTLTSDADFTDL